MTPNFFTTFDVNHLVFSCFDLTFDAHLVLNMRYNGVRHNSVAHLEAHLQFARPRWVEQM